MAERNRKLKITKKRKNVSKKSSSPPRTKRASAKQVKNGPLSYSNLEGTRLKNTRGMFKKSRTAADDITGQKKSEEALYRIEWLLQKSLKPKTGEKIKGKYCEQPYGKLTELNTCRVLLNSLTEDMLADIVSDFLDLLETSAAVYEKNGDYALRIFSSGWCRFLDQASRKLCNTSDNMEALASGKWHCHESCWTEASKLAIETGQPMDIECRGGIRIYAVPIWAGAEIVGSMNFGYGDLPRDSKKLRQIAKRHNVRFDEILEHVKAYVSRPPSIVDIAKRRLLTSAKLIGEITERRKIESVLEESERRYRGLFNYMSSGVAVYEAVENGKDFVFKDFNQAGERIDKIKKEKLIGRRVTQVFPGVKEFGLVDVFKRVWKTGKPEHHPITLYTDQRISGWRKNYVYRLPSGEIVAVYDDITERKQVEEALLQEKRRLEDVTNFINCGLLLLDEQARVTYANKISEEWFGPFHQIKGKLCWELFNLEETENQCAALKVLQTGETVLSDTFMRMVNGEDKNFYLIASPIKDNNGKIYQITEVVVDITERTQTLEALQNRTLDLTERIKKLSCLYALSKLVGDPGASIEQILQDTVELIPPSWQYPVVTCARITMEGRTFKTENFRETPWKQTSNIMLYGNRIGSIEVCYFEERPEEDEGPFTREERNLINAIAEELGRTVERQCSRAEAIRAGHLASLGELAAGVAHEINNPINGIINYAQILINKSNKKSEEHDIASRIIKESGRISDIVRNLLSFAHDSKDEKSPSHILDILSDALALTVTQITRESIKLTVDIPPDLPKIMVEPQKIGQVFLNLISNARYALNQKYPGIHEDKILEILGEEANINDCPYIRITFCDHGTGISPEILDKVMNPFFTTKSGAEGTGLGLSISHGIIREHDGRIILESQEGKFTKVIIDLPVKTKNAK